MAQIILSFMVLSLTFFGFSATVESRSSARVYLEAQCRSVVYHDLCVKTLLPYVGKAVPGPQQLARISMAVCLSKARLTKAYVNMVAKKFNQTKNFGDYQAVDACLNQISNGVNQITLSVKEFQKMGKDGEQNFMLHEGNVQSWVSAALTDADMCVDGLLGNGIGGRDKAMIKTMILNVKQLASNSLGLFNRFTMRHRASRIVKNP
ncbi:pectinesterase inhibitor 9-like [Cynara cardunculus var. scolymus]|uniref:Pectinesterase inhibitor n=1 Tax=Cynara cardunculus var. scolymus TaxID=59895 RepID=A0A103XEK1_CYNCS|nr:pectinesterase inhibitor 9-like [Cynara cardunculus var. scolymus]KVH89204.1 Pectinesterase inhibitor [Cynara cardunculus var. scolymus]